MVAHLTHTSPGGVVTKSFEDLVAEKVEEINKDVDEREKRIRLEEQARHDTLMRARTNTATFVRRLREYKVAPEETYETRVEKVLSRFWNDPREEWRIVVPTGIRGWMGPRYWAGECDGIAIHQVSFISTEGQVYGNYGSFRSAPRIGRRIRRGRITGLIDGSDETLSDWAQIGGCEILADISFMADTDEVMRVAASHVANTLARK